MNSSSFNKLTSEKVSLKISLSEICRGIVLIQILLILPQILRNGFKSSFCFGFLNLNCHRSLDTKMSHKNFEYGCLKLPALLENNVWVFIFKNCEKGCSIFHFFILLDRFLMCFLSPNCCSRLSINWGFRSMIP